MKELFERHRPHLTAEEDRDLWGRLEKKLPGRRSAWRTWRLPAGATAVATAAVAVVLLTRGTSVETPAGNEEFQIRPAPIAETPMIAERLDVPAREEKLKAQAAKDDAQAPASKGVPSIQALERSELAESAGPEGADAARGEPPAAELSAQTPTAGSSARAQASPAPAASAGSITGRVTNTQGAPLAFAEVVVLGTATTTLTDSLGRFEIRGLAPGTYSLEVAYLGHESRKLRVTVDGGPFVAETVTLTETALAMNPTEFGKLTADRGNEPSAASRPEARERSLVPEAVADAMDRLKNPATNEDGRLQLRGGRKGEIQYKVEDQGIGKSLPLVAPETASPNAAPRKDDSGWPISVGGTDPVNGQAFDSMFFEHYGVNPFIDPEDDRFATFAVDVDNASYTLARSYLDRGAMPPKEAVRVEEFINAFPHGYAPPRDGLVADRRWAPSEHGTFAIHLEAAPSPFGRGLVLLRVGLKGREIAAADRKPANLTFVVDVSGSMERENRLELVKRALFLLLDQMDRRDQVALVVYGSNARVILPPTSLAERRVIEEAIGRLHPEGATNAEAGLREGYALADRVFERGRLNRIILCSDGVANVGRTGAEGILAEIKAQARRGIYLTAVGFGMGNYNDVLMEKLADQGDGNYYYVDDIAEARRVFVENLTGTLQTIARDTKIQVEFDPDQVRRYRLLGYENRDVADRDFRNDAVDAGEVGAGHEVTALFEMKLDRRAEGTVAVVRIRYEDPETGQVTEEARTLRVDDIRPRIESADPSFRFDAAAAEFAEILRGSYWAKEGDLGQVYGLARNAARGVADREAADGMLRMIETARSLRAETENPQWRDDVRPQWEPGDDDDDR